MESKAFEMVRNGVKIAYLLDDHQNVMINAADMAKAYGKRVDVYLNTKKTAEFIIALAKVEKGVSLDGFDPDLHPELTAIGVSFSHPSYKNIIKVQSGNPTLFGEELAYDFAAWLDPYFRVWVNKQIKQQVRLEIEKVNDIQLQIAKLEKRRDSLLQIFRTDSDFRELEACNREIDKLKRQTNRTLSDFREKDGVFEFPE